MNPPYPPNTLFAVQPAEHAAFINPFRNARRVTMEERDGHPVGIEVLAGSGGQVEMFRDEASGCCAYCWGFAGHHEVSRDGLLRWIVGRINAVDYPALRQVVGTYIVLIDDRRNQRVQMTGDVMGLRPWFIGSHAGRLVCGSDVWAIQEAGLSAGGVNYDAVASWLVQAYDCTGCSLLADYSRMGAGVVATWEDGRYTQTAYATFAGATNKPPRAEIIERIHNGVSRSFDALTRDRDRIQIPLSGGYDSRYLAALASRRKHLKVDLFCVCDRQAEGLCASMAAQGLGLSLETLRTDGSLWNMFDEPYHFTPGGFPITKQVSYLAAARRPGVACLSGNYGDWIVRGSRARLEQKFQGLTGEELAVAVQRFNRPNHNEARFDLLDADLLRRCDERALAVWRKQASGWSGHPHVFAAINLFVRQRFYMSNNFLQYMDLAETILPFAGFDLLDYMFHNDATCYEMETYEALFRAFFPEIAHVPHNVRLGAKNDLRPKPSRCSKAWAAELIQAICRPRRLPIVSRRKTIPRLIGATIGRRDVQTASLFLYRLLLLEKRCRRAGLNFDWSAI